MKIVSIEPTPSPNSMKLNLDESLPEGKTLNYTAQNKQNAPDYIQQLLAVEGIKGVYQVMDFMAIERSPRTDWKVILPAVKDILGVAEASKSEEGGSVAESVTGDQPVPDEAFGEVNVFVQMFKGIPVQVKLIAGSEERRFGLPERFQNALMRAQSSSDNYIFERKWVEQDVRYGDMDEIGQQVTEELSAAYDDERLEQLVKAAFEEDAAQENKSSDETQHADDVLPKLDHPDWKVRYAALERMKLTEEEIPVLRKALDDPKMSIRRLATAYLGEIGGKEALQLLYKALQDETVAVRRTAGDAISDIGDPAAIDVMIEALKDENKLVRWRAARFMYEVGDKRAIPALRAAEDDPEFEVSLQVKMALERIEAGEKAEGTVWQQMTEQFSGGRTNN